MPTMLNKAVILGAFLLGTGLAPSALAETIDVNLGVFSFDVLNPASGQSAGENQFTIYNFTGANNLAPDFAVATDILFQNSSVNVGTGQIDLGSINSGGAGIQPPSLEFLSTEDFASAIFDATLSSTSIQLADGTVVQLLSDQVSGVIVPSQGQSLTAGTDFALLTAEGTVDVAPVPEASNSSYEFIATVVLIAAGLTSKSRHRASS